MAEYTDNFDAGHTASDWTHHGDSATRDATNDEFDYAIVGADFISVFDINNSGSLDHEAQVSVRAHSGAENIFVGPGVRMYDNASYDCYGVWGDESANAIYIGKATSGGNIAQIGSALTHTITPGDYFTLTLAAIDNGANVDLSLWVVNHGATKPASDPDWTTSATPPTADLTVTDSTSPLNNATNHVDCGIAGDNAVSTDYDTQHDWFKLRAISDRAAGAAAVISAASSSRGSDIATANETLTITVDDSTGVTTVTVNGESCTSVATPTGTSVTCTCPLAFAADYGTSGNVIVDNGTPSTGYAVTLMQPGGMTEADFTVAYASLDANSPFSGVSTYSALVSGDSCVYDAVSAEDAIALSMDSLGAFTVTGSYTVNQTYSFYIFDTSDNTAGTISTLTALPSGDVVLGTGKIITNPITVVITAIITNITTQ